MRMTNKLYWWNQILLSTLVLNFFFNLQNNIHILWTHFLCLWLKTCLFCSNHISCSKMLSLFLFHLFFVRFCYYLLDKTRFSLLIKSLWVKCLLRDGTLNWEHVGCTPTPLERNRQTFFKGQICQVFETQTSDYVYLCSFILQVLYFVLEVNGTASLLHFSSLILWDKFDGLMMGSEVFFPSHLILP